MTRESADKDTTKEDLRGTLASFQSGLRGQVEDRRQALTTIATVAVVTLLVVSYFLGRRGGRRRNTVVEIRRV